MGDSGVVPARRDRTSRQECKRGPKAYRPHPAGSARHPASPRRAQSLRRSLPLAFPDVPRLQTRGLTRLCSRRPRGAGPDLSVRRRRVGFLAPPAPARPHHPVAPRLLRPRAAVACMDTAACHAAPALAQVARWSIPPLHPTQRAPHWRGSPPARCPRARLAGARHHPHAASRRPPRARLSLVMRQRLASARRCWAPESADPDTPATPTPGSLPCATCSASFHRPPSRCSSLRTSSANWNGRRHLHAARGTPRFQPVGELRSRTAPRILLRADDLSRAATLLANAGEMVDPIDAETLAIALGARQEAELNRMLVESGLQVSHLVREQPSLESLFFQLAHA